MIKQFLFYSFLFIYSSVGFSQTAKNISGRLVSEGTALPAIDIVNSTTKKVTKSDNKGNFTIQAKMGDELYIISNDYFDQQITVFKKLFEQESIVIELEKRPIELDGVTVSRAESMKIKVTQADMDEAKLIKQQNTLKVQNVHTGEIENGVDFVRIGKGIGNWFKKKQKPFMDFREYIALHFKSDFFINELKLKPDEVPLFLAFCEVDIKSKGISERQNLLETTKFLLNKNEDFKKPIESNK